MSKNINVKESTCLIISIDQDDKAIKLSQDLRDAEINCSIMYGKPTKALEYANNKKIPFVIFIGEQEIRKGKFKLRDMKTGKEKLTDIKGLIKSLK